MDIDPTHNFITVERRTVRKTGKASIGWMLGHGHVQKTFTIKKKTWCILEGGRIIAECRNKYTANRIAALLQKDMGV
jgi:hypothetical protein